MIAASEQPSYCLSLSLCSLRSFAASCAAFSQPHGNDAWVDRVTERFDPESVFRPRGRPYKECQDNGSRHLFSAFSLPAFRQFPLFLFSQVKARGRRFSFNEPREATLFHLLVHVLDVEPE